MVRILPIPILVINLNWCRLWHWIIHVFVCVFFFSFALWKWECLTLTSLWQQCAGAWLGFDGLANRSWIIEHFVPIQSIFRNIWGLNLIKLVDEVIIYASIHLQSKWNIQLYIFLNSSYPIITILDWLKINKSIHWFMNLDCKWIES